MTREEARGAWIPGWVLLAFVATLGVHAAASFTTTVSIDLMRSMSEFATEVRQFDLGLLPYWRLGAYVLAIGAMVAYSWPLIGHFRCGAPQPVPPVVRRRAVSFPAVVAIVGIALWVLATLFFPLVTLARFGRWSTELMSQQVLSPLVNGFLAATSSYLLVDWIFRVRVIPFVFPDGRVTEVSGTIAMGVRSRLLIYLAAVAFIPLFTMLGLARTAQVRFQSGVGVDELLSSLARGSTGVFLVYTAFGVVLTLVLARTFTIPLSDVVAALRRVQGGDLSVNVKVESGDEVGRLQDGVNEVVSGLREKERILTTFGRVVEPAVRDRLLSGDLRAGGEARTATVMFCDLRGFTGFAEAAPPDEVVSTLNDYFTTVTVWVRECGGFVDKFIGDALLVVFGVFDEKGEDSASRGAAAAVRCALGVRERLERLNRTRADAGKPPLAVSMAVHTGPVVAGIIGAQDRHEYTVIGDTVNIAARLQQLGKERDLDLIVSDAAYELAKDDGVDIAAGEHDSVVPRGRNQPVSFVALA